MVFYFAGVQADWIGNTAAAEMMAAHTRPCVCGFVCVSPQGHSLPAESEFIVDAQH